MRGEAPFGLALGPIALAANEFWCAALGAREALDRGHTALAAAHLKHLGDGIPGWPAPLRARGIERGTTLEAALSTALALEALP